MLRALLGVVQQSTRTPLVQNVLQLKPIEHVRTFSLINTQIPASSSLLNNPKIQAVSYNISSPVTKYSWRKGKRKSVSNVLQRFYRLNWGIWIRTKCGRNKKLWKKTANRQRRLRQHVFCNATQSHLLDKMVGSYWRKPKYYVDDPYEPYHSREEFRNTYKIPRPYIPKEEQC